MTTTQTDPRHSSTRDLDQGTWERLMGGQSPAEFVATFPAGTGIYTMAESVATAAFEADRIRVITADLLDSIARTLRHEGGAA